MSRQACLLLGYAALLGCFLLVLLEREPLDDAFFFKRVALNALDHGMLAWNVDEGPVYGITSQLHQVLVLGATAITRNFSMLAVRLLMAACLAGAVALMFRTTWRKDRGVATVVTFCSPVALFATVSGMETPLVFLLSAAFVWSIYGTTAGASRFWPVAPSLVVLAWLTRPDVLLLLLPVLFFERWRSSGSPPLREAIAVGAGVLSFLLLFWAYYGSALPLPFYAKQLLLSPYGEEFIEISSQVQMRRFGIFLVAALPGFLVGLMRRDRTNVVLLGSVVVFELYHLVSTVEVMGQQGRFYAPALPLIALAAARSLALPHAARIPHRELVMAAAAYAAVLAALALAGFLPPLDAPELEAVPLAHYGICLIGAVSLGLALRAPRFRPKLPLLVLAAAAVFVTAAGRPRFPRFVSDAEYVAQAMERVTVYRGLGLLRSCLGDSLHVYHSEVGVPGLLFARGKITDLAGLFSPKWLFRQKSFDELCSEDVPHAIFLPHKNYGAFNREILGSRCLTRYRRVVSESSSPLYVRADLLERLRGSCRGLGEPPL